jgi:hypothetical protein
MEERIELFENRVVMVDGCFFKSIHKNQNSTIAPSQSKNNSFVELIL